MLHTRLARLTRPRDARRLLVACALLAGACSGTTDPDAPARGAVLEQRRPVTISVVGSGRGAVAVMPGGIACTMTAACAPTFAVGTAVTLVAAPEAGSRFGGWSGGACGAGEACTFTVAEAQQLTASFVAAPTTYGVTVATTGGGTGIVASEPAGISCGRGSDGGQSGTCAATLAGGSTVTLRASATGTSAFAGWTGACTGSGACVLTVDAARAVTAAFAATEAPTHLLAVSTAGAGSGAVRSDPLGISCARAVGATSGACAARYAPDTRVTLSAAPASGSIFRGWSAGTCADARTTCTLTLAAADSVVATFDVAAPEVFALTVSTTGGGTGDVVSDPAGISCQRTAEEQRGACAESFRSDAPVLLTARPTHGSTFVGWSGGGCEGTAPCTVAMSAGRAVTAEFARPTVTVAVRPEGDGSGSVRSPSAAILCTRSAGANSGSCEARVAPGQTVDLGASAAVGSVFAGWYGGGCAGTGACRVEASETQTVRAQFVRVSQTLAVTTAGSGAGQVTSAPIGIACARAGGAQSGSCDASLPGSATVVLTAQADAASSDFAGWGGACAGAGSSPTCTVTMSAARAVTATFTGRATLSLTLAGTGGGTVVLSPDGGSCSRAAFGTQSGACQATTAIGAAVTLTATPAAGSAFTGWSGACTGASASCTVPMSAAHAVTATFSSHLLTVTLGGIIHPGGATRITSSPAGIDCSATATACSAAFVPGTVVTLSVVTPPGTTFGGWSGGCTSSQSACTVTMDAARIVTATLRDDISPPLLQLTGVTDGATYVMHPAVSVAYQDAIGFGLNPLRLTWSVVANDGSLWCASTLAGRFVRIVQPGVTSCPVERTTILFGTFPAPAGMFTLTAQVGDVTGNLSAPITVRYTVTSATP